MSDTFTPPLAGWVNDPAAAIQGRGLVQAIQGVPLSFADAAPQLAEAADDDRDVVFWKAEEAILKSIQRSWNQGQVGTCVSFGFGRGCNDLILLQCVAGKSQWPGTTVATEPIYAGSRVEVGGGRISGDGSVGSWALAWLMKWGVLLRKTYGSIDLTLYSESRSRDWGRRGCPDELEPVAKQFPVKKGVQVRTTDEAWKLLGNFNPIPVCSNVGFDSPLVEGFCEAAGSWGHCMLTRGRVLARRRGSLQRAYPIQNSWGAYLRGEPFYIDRNGDKQPLPEGCFLADEEDYARILRADDSYAIDDANGFAPRNLDWLI